MLPALSSSSRGSENSVGWRAASGEAAENRAMAPQAVGCGRLGDSAVCGFRQMGRDSHTELPRPAPSSWPAARLWDMTGPQVKATPAQGHFRASFQGSGRPGTDVSSQAHPPQRPGNASELPGHPGSVRIPRGQSRL